MAPRTGTPSARTSRSAPAARSNPTTGALYQALRRLTDDGLIAPVEGRGDADPRRKYFALTREGRRAAAKEAERLDALVRTARQRKLYPQRA